jgi:tRNA(Ile)-lysidine synthase
MEYMREVNLDPGKYVVAVSGGVDSVVLLDVLRQLSGVELIVAHVDHGIRADSHKDALLVRALAEEYGLPCEETRLELNGRTDEDTARRARHEWLESVYAHHRADGIITAHHRDDVLETIFINLIRGTGWRGLQSLRETDLYRRPFIAVPKIDIVTHAINQNLSWHEDSTNDDVRYLRNYVRNGIIPRLSLVQIDELYALYENQCKMGEMITAASKQLLRLASDGEGSLSRYWLIMTPDKVARELLRQTYGAMTADQLSRLLIFARTARQGAKLELSKQHAFRVTSRRLIVGTS